MRLRTRNSWIPVSARIPADVWRFYVEEARRRNEYLAVVIREALERDAQTENTDRREIMREEYHA